MSVLDGRAWALGVLVAALTPAKAMSAIVYGLGGGVLEDNKKGDTATFPADDESGIIGTITTIEVVQSDGTTGGTLNENTGSLGINNLTGADARFNGSESWTFYWNVDTRLDLIDFEALTSSQSFLLKSTAWLDNTYVSSNSKLTFDSGDGQFTFGNDGNDIFDLTSTITGDSLLVAANTPYTLSFDDGGDGGNAGIDAFTFSAPVTANATAAPEPGSAVALLGLAGAVVAKRWRRKRKQTAGSESAE